MQREVQRVMEVVIEIRAGADHEVDQAALHQLDDAAAEAGGRERARDGQADGGVVGRGQHLVGVDVAGLGQPAGVERLEAALDQRPDLGAPRRPVVADLFSLEKLAGTVARGSGRSVGHVQRITNPMVYLDSRREGSDCTWLRAIPE